MKARNVDSTEDYKKYVENLAEILIEEGIATTETGEIDIESVHETVDSDRLITTHINNAINCIKYSETSEVPTVSSVKVNEKDDLRKVAFHVLEHDLRRVLREKLDE